MASGRAVPHLVDWAFPSDQTEQVEVKALQVRVAAPALQSDCGGFAQDLQIIVFLEKDADGFF